MKKELTLVVVCILTHIVRLTYEIMKHRKTIRPGKVSFIIVFADMILLWVSWFLICKYDYHEIHLPGIIRSVGLLLSVGGIISFLTGLFTLKTLESYEGDLITTGIYSFIRHPMYAGFITWLIGFPLFFEALLPLILSVFLILNVLFWRHLEEKELEQRFPSYRDYRKRTIF